MCGIVGGVGNIPFRRYLIDGLKKLEYRGYDSSGMAYFEHGELVLKKVAGRVSSLEAVLPPEIEASAGIAHTRWATHGQPNATNAHPHRSNKGYFTIVHNGVIENFRSIQHQLLARGFSFETDTDTEIIANVLERFYLRSASVIEALYQTSQLLEGSFACAILFKNEPDRLYFMKRSSPLLIGKGNGASFLSSDPAPMIGYADAFADLNDGDYGYLTSDEIVVHNNGQKTEVHFAERDLEYYQNDLLGYPHYMLKEIEESPSVLLRLIDNYYDGERFLFNDALIQAIHKTKKIHFLACGTSYHASKLGAKYFRPLGKEVLVSIASEWAYDPYDVSEDTLFILLSQSGETADLIRCQKIINSRGATNVAVTNRKGSTIERKATFSALLYAGLEVAVASTKSYVAQVCFLALLAAAIRGETDAVLEIDGLVHSMKDILSRKEEIKALAEECASFENAFFVGRGYDYLASLEGALKLKEVAYVHAEAYPGGELKHGPIALVEPSTLILGLVSDPFTSAATRNNFEEIRARKGHLIVFSSSGVSSNGDSFIVSDVKPYLAPCALVLAIQLFVYYVALAKGLPIDKPRNLAKSVTVE